MSDRISAALGFVVLIAVLAGLWFLFGEQPRHEGGEEAPSETQP